MIKVSIVVPNAYKENRLFDLQNVVLNRDNCLYPFYLLKQKFLEKGYELATHDIHSISTSSIVLYNEMPKQLPRSDQFEKSYLLLFESELIRPDNWDIEKHEAFNKVFTWHDGFIDNENYSKINFSFAIPSSITKDISRKQKLCTLIAGNKKVQHPKELYSKRIDAIRWFEKNHPQDFDLYGIGWDRYRFSGPIWVRAFNKLSFITKLLSPGFPSYKGKVDTKIDTLEKYRFAICYENARDIPGYITEKIFDCFFAGCVPIYWGAGNVAEHIPKDCFIDKREFSTYESLYQYISNLSDIDYFNYQINIENYLNSDQVQSFSAESFAKTIVNQVIK